MLIKKWRNRAGLSQQKMSDIFEIPKRTIEDWDAGKSTPAPWVEKLIVEKLINLTESEYQDKMRILANKCKSDENGNRPVVSWAIITSNGNDEFIDLQPDLETCLKIGEPGAEIACILCNFTNNKIIPWYEDQDGKIYSDHYGFNFE